jgi:hypothetical protein
MRFIVFPKKFFSLPLLFKRLIILCFLSVLPGAWAFADVGQANVENSRRLYKQAQKLSKKRQFVEAEALFGARWKLIRSLRKLKSNSLIF